MVARIVGLVPSNMMCQYKIVSVDIDQDARRKKKKRKEERQWQRHTMTFYKLHLEIINWQTSPHKVTPVHWKSLRFDSDEL